MMFGSDSLTATAPKAELWIWPSVIFAQCSPPSVVFQRPPPGAPKWPTLGWPVAPGMAIERPPRSGPTLRHLSDLKIEVSTGFAFGAFGAIGCFEWVSPPVVQAARVTVRAAENATPRRNPDIETNPRGVGSTHL